MNSQNEEHLKLLSIFHYVLAAFPGLLGCFFLIYFLLGLFFMFIGGAAAAAGEEAPPFLLFGGIVMLQGGILIFIGVALVFFFWFIALFLILAGKNISARKKYNFCFVVACASCVLMPLGTILGVFTILVLSKPEVKELFE